MNQSIQRIAVSTGGGDAPGLNAVIRAVVLSALGHGWECIGIRDGYRGLLEPDLYPDGGLISLDREYVRGITHLGGTILGTTNRGNPLAYPTLGEDGQWFERDRGDELVERLRAIGADALVAIGGDGSLAIANTLFQRGVRVIGVPKTIDNDLAETVVTFGFDTAVSFAAEAVDRLHSTAEAHDRVMVVEVMGRYAGWIALHAGLGGTADSGDSV
jgi:6-phosphofructokinase